MGGATEPGAWAVNDGAGLSPRGRGNRHYGSGIVFILRSIPAWAGQPVNVRRSGIWSGGYPRVGGATLPRSVAVVSIAGLSPRGRGNRKRGRVETRDRRSIPAWAGQPNYTQTVPRGQRVYPRVGGATELRSIRPNELFGLSPRGRGNLEGPHQGFRGEGSIPAWAGQP